MDNKIKYVDLNGLKVFAESLKQDLKNHVIELGLYQELLHRIENLELYKIVDSLPETGDENTIYLLKNPSGSGDKNVFIEYLYNNEHGWEEIGNFTPSFDLEDYVKVEDAPFKKGISENSAVLKGGNNQVISEGGVALGEDNLVGLKGFYYKYITLKAGGNTKLANVYLSKTQVSNPTIDTNSGASFKDTSIKPQNYWAVGDIISIVNDAKYDDIATVKQIKDGLVQIEWLDGKSPFSTVKPESDLSPEDYSIYCLDKPIEGISDLGKYSFATGTNNKAINVYTEVSGKGNVAKGKFGKVWGKDNVGGYNTTTFGSGNTNLADNSLVGGTNNINEGNNSVVFGNKNKNYGKRAFIVGNENITNNENEAAFGKYNNSKNDTQFSIGVGTSDTDRGNAFEVKQNGDVYITRVEKPIQTELAELSAEVSGLSERIDNLPSGESDVFKAVYGETTYNEIIEAHNEGRIVICQDGVWVTRLTRVQATQVQFQCSSFPNVTRLTCSDANVWSRGSFNVEHNLETLANGNVKIKVATQTAEVATPQYVENAIQQSGGSSATPDWDAQEGEAGFIKNKTHYVNGFLITAAGNYGSASRNIIYKGNTYTLPEDGTKLQLEIGPPVYAYYQRESSQIYVESVSPDYLETYPIKVVEEIVHLADLYIPDTIARKSELTELSAEVDKKVDADKVATINGKSLINGGKNIVIEGGTGGADSPVGYGDTENSAILKGEYEGYSNKAISQTSMAVGAATMSGLKGWYYSAIDFTNKKITLSDKPTYILAGSTLIGGNWLSGIPNIKVDDVISLVNNSKYDLCSKVTAVNGNVITVDSLPFTGLVRDGGAAASVIAGQFSDGYSLYIPERPDAGIIDFGGGAFSEGGQSKASNICAHAEGLQTHAYGQYSHTEGRETKAGYIAHAEGSKTKAIGNASHAEGTNTQALNSNSHAEGYNTETKGYAGHAEGYYTKVLANYGHAEGYYTKTFGIASHAEGYGESLEKPNLAQGNYSHVEGEKTKALGIAAHSEGGSTVATGNFSHSEGRFTRAHGLWSHVEGGSVEGDEDNYGAFGPISHCEGYATKTYSTANSAHVEGRFTEANNMAEHACGIYNKSTKSSDASHATHFSIGIGTANTNRKNAVEVKQNGDVYIIGVGGYDGTNSNSAQTLQEILANL